MDYFSLLETGLWSALLIYTATKLLSYQSTNREKIELSALLTLMVFCRPESMLWVPLFLFILACLEFDRHRKPLIALSKITLPVLTFIISISMLVGWRLWYFGYPVPNTYYAKMSTDMAGNIKDGIKYLYLFAINNPISSLITLALFFTAIKAVMERKISSQNKIIWIGTLIMLVTFFIPLYTGGDVFAMSRFIQPSLPIIIAVFSIALLTMNVQYSKLGALAFCLFLSLTGEYSYFKIHMITGKAQLQFQYGIPYRDRHNSELLNKFFKPLKKLPSQGVLPAGATAFSYEGKTCDLLGLNNVAMAHASTNRPAHLPKGHQSFNKKVFFQQQPDLVWFSSKFTKETMASTDTVYLLPFHKAVLLEIQKDPKFLELYSFALISNQNMPERLLIFARKEFLYSLDKQIYQYQTIPFK